VLLVLPATAAPAGPLPDPPADLPALPDTPTVGVTPGSDGVTADLGAGDTTLQVGAGAGGLTVKRGTRGSNAGTGAGDSLPVSIPTLRPGRERMATGAGTGQGGVLFGPPGSAKAATAGRASRPGTASITRPGTTNRPESERRRAPSGSADSRTSRLPPFLEFVDRIPPAMKAAIAALALIALAIWAAWVRARRRLAGNAFVDPVTGVANAPAFEGLLARELERAKRYKRPLALLVLEVSDAHESVLPLLDHRLREVSEAIQERLRAGDVVARLGSSRFAVISPEATVASAETLARALELRLEEMRVHVSIGMAERQPTDLGPRHLLARAEAGLAKPDPGPGADRPQRRALLKAA
jgi:diguanylate cyclase (GGDEF)-like protein